MRSLAILEKAVGETEDAQITDEEVKLKLKEVEAAEHISDCFPRVLGLTFASAGNGAVIHLSVTGKKHLPIVAVPADGATAVVGVRELHPEDSHPHRTQDLVERTGLSRNRLLGVIAELGLKDNPDCCYFHGPRGSQKTPGYSEKAVHKIRQFVETYDGDIGVLYVKHIMKRKKRGR